MNIDDLMRSGRMVLLQPTDQWVAPPRLESF